jgi:hypothetical protein
MKKLFFIVGLVGLCGIGSAQPNFNLFSQTKQIQFLQPTNLAGGTVYSAPVDVGGFGGVVDVVITAISNGVAGDATITIYHANTLTNAAAGWLPISNACIGNWTVTTTTNLAATLGTTNGLCTNVVNQVTEAFTAKASVTTSSNSTYVIGIPVRENNPYWQIGITNGGSSLRALSAVIIGRNMQSN